jgi:hypothetical protein
MEDNKSKQRELLVEGLKRTMDVFIGNSNEYPLADLDAKRKKMDRKIADEYSQVKDLPPPRPIMPEHGDVEEEEEQEQPKFSVQRVPSEPSTALVVVEPKAQGAAAGSSRAVIAVKPQKTVKPAWHAPWKLMRVSRLFYKGVFLEWVG